VTAIAPEDICAGKGCGSRSQVAWCAIWRLWLCVDCRKRHTDAELAHEPWPPVFRGAA
jgi:hypothetical protein